MNDSSRIGEGERRMMSGKGRGSEADLGGGGGGAGGGGGGGERGIDRGPAVVDGRYQGPAMINDPVQYCFH